MATTQIETVNAGADKVKVGFSVIAVIAALAGFYALDKQWALVQWAVLLVGLGAAVAIFFASEQGKELRAFARDSWAEIGKVVWPERKESFQMTAYVFAFVLVMAVFLWLTDKTLEWLLYGVILGWRS